LPPINPRTKTGISQGLLSTTLSKGGPGGVYGHSGSAGAVTTGERQELTLGSFPLMRETKDGRVTTQLASVPRGRVRGIESERKEEEEEGKEEEEEGKEGENGNLPGSAVSSAPAPGAPSKRTVLGRTGSSITSALPPSSFSRGPAGPLLGESLKAQKELTGQMRKLGETPSLLGVTQKKGGKQLRRRTRKVRS
jgi:hypothetical protein